MSHGAVRHALYLSSAIYLCAGWGGAAFAQTAGGEPAAREATTLGEIVVTARRQEENLQTTPVAVTALGAEAIKNAQITDTVGMQRAAPSLSISTGSPGNSGFTYISIRGAGTLNPGVANDPSVATYVDGVYIPRPSQGVTDLYDVQRAEVLRGPQGTLFGRNTTGGALNIISNDPTGDLEGELRLQAGNYSSFDANAILNVPIVGEQLAARFVYGHSEHDGYSHNATADRDSNDRKSDFFRGKIRVAPDDSDWRATLEGDYNKITDHGQFVGLAAFLPTANPVIGIAAATTPGGLGQYIHTKDNWYTNYGIPFANNFYTNEEWRGGNLPYNFLEAYGTGLTVEGKLGDVDVKSTSAYRYSLSIGRNELDGTPVSILATESFYKSKQLSEELQFSGNLSEKLSYILGGYYGYETGQEGSLSQTFGFFAPAAPPPNFGYAVNLSDVTNTSMGTYGQFYYALTDTVRLTGGLRWTWDKREVSLHNLTNAFLNTCSAEITSLPGFQIPCSFPRSAKFDYPAWTVGLDWKMSDDIFLYAKTSGAAKAGGFNLRNGSASTPPFDPEKVKDVELGAKISGFDNRVRLNTALFYSWQSDVQRNAAALVNIGNVVTSTQYLLNAGKQDIYGAEFEFTAVPWEGMTLAANLALLRGHYVDGSFTEIRDIPGAGLPGCTAVPGNAAQSRCVVDRSGEDVPQLPHTQFNLSATQKWPTSIGEFTFFANYSYISSQTYDSQTVDPRQSLVDQINLQRQIDLGTVKGYGLLDGRIALQLDGPDVELYVYGKNITGQKYNTRRFNSLYTSLGVAIDYIGNPSTYGVGVTYRFGGPR